MNGELFYKIAVKLKVLIQNFIFFGSVVAVLVN